MKDIFILAIETSCDETAASVVKNGRTVLSNVISSQIELHMLYGGVVPEIASRKHIENIDDVVSKALLDANVTLLDVDAIAVTNGPGLVGALLVGVSYAKTLAFTLNKPLIAVHHIKGHICANYIQNIELEPPFVCLVASGGHTHIVLVKNYIDYEVIGKTRDDAAGEAFDKVARSVKMGYPGGPKIDAASKLGNKLAIDFPKVYLEENSFDFSFSGIKSSVLNYINKKNMQNEEININDLAASFQHCVVDVLVKKTVNAALKLNVSKVCLAGGVASNSCLQEEMTLACEKNKLDLCIPSNILCTDNAAMIGCAAYFKFLEEDFSDMYLNAYANMSLESLV